MSALELDSAIAYSQYVQRGLKSGSEDLYYSQCTVRRTLKKEGYELNPTGRTGVPLSFRSAMLRMYIEGHQGWSIAHHLSLRGESTLHRVKRDTLTPEAKYHAVGMLIINPYTGEVLIHKEKYANPTIAKFEQSKSIQLSWKGPNENDHLACMRTFQKEVYAQPIQKEQFGAILQPIYKTAAVQVRVADVLVSIYGYVMTEEGLKLQYSSPKVDDIHWAGENEVLDSITDFRSGAREALEVLLKVRKNEAVITSRLNEDYIKRISSKKINIPASGIIL